MSSEKKGQHILSWAPVRTGALGLLLTLALLMAFAFMISRKVLPEKYNGYIVPVSALLAGMAARKLTDDRREGGALLKAVLAALCMTLLMLLASAGIKEACLHLKGILTTAGAYAVGDLLGSMVKVNKKYRQKHNQRSKYNRKQSAAGR